MPSAWIHDELLNALSELNVTAIRTSFQRPGAVVFGWHYFFYGGSARSPLIFGEAVQVIDHIEKARRGDHFTLYDLDHVASLANLHLGDPATPDPISITSEDRSQLAEAGSRSRWREMVLVQRACSGDGRLARCCLVEMEPESLTDQWDLFKEYNADLTWPADGAYMPVANWFGELFAFDEADLDRNAESSQAVETVSAGGLRRTHVLVDAKRPDDRGLVPESGAY